MPPGLSTGGVATTAVAVAGKPIPMYACLKALVRKQQGLFDGEPCRDMGLTNNRASGWRGQNCWTGNFD